MKRFVLLALLACAHLIIAQESDEDDIDVGDIKIASRAIFTYTEGFGCVEGTQKSCKLTLMIRARKHRMV